MRCRSAYARWALNAIGGADAGTGVGGRCNAQLSATIAVSVSKATAPLTPPRWTSRPFNGLDVVPGTRHTHRRTVVDHLISRTDDSLAYQERLKIFARNAHSAS